MIATPTQSELIILTRAEIIEMPSFLAVPARRGQPLSGWGSQWVHATRWQSQYTEALVGLHTNGLLSSANAPALHQQAAADDDTPWQPKTENTFRSRGSNGEGAACLHPLCGGKPPSRMRLVIGSLESQ